MEASGERVERTYGAWWLAKSFGLFGLRTWGTAAMFAALVVWIPVMIFAGLLLGLALFVLVVPGVWWATREDRHHRTRGHKLVGWVARRRADAKGNWPYRSGPAGRVPSGRFTLPGVLAGTSLYEFEDAYRRKAAVIHHPSVGHAAVVIRTMPDGAARVDAEVVDRRVAEYGEFQAAMCEEAGLVAFSATIETAPATAAALEDAMSRRVAPDAPAPARQLVSEIVDDVTRGAAELAGWVTLTYALESGHRRRGLEDRLRELVERLPVITEALERTGAGIARPASAQQVCEMVRVAYDPGIEGPLEDARAAGHLPTLSWSDVGPHYADAKAGYYKHDSGYSITWAMSDAPRAHVTHTVLERLLAPHPAIDRKRVTLIYRPLDPGESARHAEQDLKAAAGYAQTNGTAAGALQLQAAQQIASEQARGASMVDFALLVTVTVTDRARLADARDAINSARGRIVLREMRDAQQVGFAASLPLGVVLSAHLPTASLQHAIRPRLPGALKGEFAEDEDLS